MRPFPDSVRKTFFVILAVLVAATAAPILLLVRVEQSRDREAAVRTMENAVGLQVSHLDRWFERNMIEEVRTLAGLSSVRARDFQAMLDDFRTVIEGQADLASLTYIDARGYPAVDSDLGVTPVTSLSFADRAYFQAARRGEEAVSSILIDRVSGEPVIAFAVPLMREKSFDGLILGAVQLDHLAATISSHRFGQSGRFRLFNGSDLDLERFDLPSDASAGFDGETIRKKGSLLTETLDSSGKPAFLYVVPVSQGGLFVGGVLSLEEVRAGSRRIARATIAGILLLGGAGVGFFVFLSRRISRSLDILDASLSSVAEGIYDPLPQETLSALPQEMRGIARAVNGLKKAVSTSFDEIRERGIRDPLTGLHNRVFFDEELARLARGDQDPVTVVMCDINGLKLINDGLGHHWGDRLIEKAARILHEAAGPDDIVARIGGDEFALILPQSDGDRERSLEEQLKTRLRESQDDGDDIPLYMAWGIARGDAARRSLEEIVKDADERMYARKEQRRADTQKGILDIFLRRIRRRERRRISHMERCRAIMKTFLIARPGIDDSFRERMARLASLHDIGFAGVDADLFGKRGPLTAEERRAIRSHPEIGYRITSAIPHLADLAEAILHHHQRWDGRGYPFRKTPLAGEAIPLESRVMSLVDAYEAMTGRTYASPRSHGAAIAEIRLCAGSQFDPRWAEAFARFLEQWEPI